jgi:hypothetical protein
MVGRALVQIHQLQDEVLVGADRAGDVVRGAADELGHAVHHDVRAQLLRAQQQWAEGVVDDQFQAAAMGDLGQRRYVRHPQGRVGDALGENGPGPRRDGRLDRVEVRDVDQGRRDACLGRQEVVQQGIGAAVDRVRRNQVVTGIAQLEQGAGNGRHSAGRAVRSLGAFQRRELPGEVVDGRVEVPAVQVAAAPVGAALAVEHLGQDVGVHCGEGRAGLDRHVDPAVLAELVAGVGQGLDRVFELRVPDDVSARLHAATPVPGF